MSESRMLRNPEPGERERWRAEFEELEIRVEALRQAVMEGARAFNLDNDVVERMHSRFTEVGDQWQQMRCLYPFGGWPGQEECRVEPHVAYESEAEPQGGAGP